MDEKSLERADGVGVRQVRTGEELGELPEAKPGCGCTLNPVTRERQYCSAHRAHAIPQDLTPKGQVMEALARARAMLTPLRDLNALDAITLRGYLDYALTQLAKVEVLKKARPGEGSRKKRTTTTGG